MVFFIVRQDIFDLVTVKNTIINHTNCYHGAVCDACFTVDVLDSF